MVRPSSAPPGSAAPAMGLEAKPTPSVDRKSTRLNSSHLGISYAVFCFTNDAPTTEISSLPLHDALPILEDGAPILGAAGLSRAGHGIGGEANAIGVAPVVGDGFAAHFDLGGGVGLELAAVQKARGAGGEGGG